MSGVCELLATALHARSVRGTRRLARARERVVCGRAGDDGQCPDREPTAGGRPRVSFQPPRNHDTYWSSASLMGGRRLLSDDIATLETVGLLVARRIDAIRITRERTDRQLREQEIDKLSTEAELRALESANQPALPVQRLDDDWLSHSDRPEPALLKR